MANTITALLKLLGDASGAVKAIGDVDRNLTGLQKTVRGVQNVGDTLSRTVTPAIVGMATAATAASIKFESGFAGVMKTVDGLGDSTQNLTALGEEMKQGFRDLANTIPIASDKLLQVGEAAGQLGIKTQNIIGFTRVMAEMGETTNLSAQEAALALARFANVTGMSQEKFSNLGSTVVELGNNLATSEREIVDMAQRLAGAGTTAGLTEQEIITLAGAMSELGINAQAGGTAMSRVLIDISNAVADGGEKMETFAEVAGMTGEEFSQAFSDEPVKALDAFISGLDRMQEEGGNVFAVLDELELSEVRVRDALLRLANTERDLTDVLDMANGAWDENLALTEEAQKRFETTASKLKLLRNRALDIAVTFGDVLLPHVIKLADKLLVLAERFADMSDGAQTAIVTFGAVAAAAGPVLSISARMVTSISTLASALGSIATATGVATVLGEIATAFGLVASGAGMAEVATLGFAGAVGGVALPVAGAVAALGALVVAIKKVDEWEDKHLTTQQKLARGYGIGAQIVAEQTEATEEAAPSMKELAAASALGAGQLSDYAAMAEAAKGKIVTLADVQERSAEKARQAAQKQAEAQRDLERQLNAIQLFISGPIKKANEQYVEQEEEILSTISDLQGELEEYERKTGMLVGSQEDLVIAQADLQEETEDLADAQQALSENTDPDKQLELEAAVARAKKEVNAANDAVSRAGPHHVSYREQIEETKGKIDEWMGKLREAAEAHKEHIQEIILQILEARLAQEGWTEDAINLYSGYAEAAGVMDEKTAEAWRSVGEVVNETHATTEEKVGALIGITDRFVKDALGPEAEALLYNTEQSQALAEKLDEVDGAMDGASGKAKNLEGDMNRLGGELEGVTQKAGDVKGALDNLPSSKRINIELHTTHTGMGGIPEEAWNLNSPVFTFQLALENLAESAQRNPVNILINVATSGVEALASFFAPFAEWVAEIEELDFWNEEEVQEWADAITAFSETVLEAIEGMRALADFERVDLSGFAGFFEDVKAVFGPFADWVADTEEADAWREDEIGDWAGAVEDTMGMVQEAVAALAAVADYVRPKRDQIAAVGQDILWLSQEVAGRLKEARERMTVAASEGAEAFWAQAETFVEMVEAAVGSLLSLSDYVSPSRDAITQVGADILAMGEEIAGRMKGAREAMEIAASEDAEAFWSQAEAFADMISGAVEALASLRDYVSPGREAIAQLGRDIVAMGEEISGRLKEAREAMSGEAVEHAEAFWAQVETFVGMVSGAADLIIKLGEADAGSLAAGFDAYDDALDRLADIVAAVVRTLDDLVNRDLPAVEERHVEFASRVSGLFAPLERALGFLLAASETTPKEMLRGWMNFGFALAASAEALTLVVEKMGELTDDLLPELTDKAKDHLARMEAFARVAGQLIGPLEEALGFIVQVADLEAMDLIDALMKMYAAVQEAGLVLELALEKMRELANDLLPELNDAARDELERTEEFAGIAGRVIAPLNEAIGFIADLADHSLQDLLDGFERAENLMPRIEAVIRDVASRMRRMAEDLLTDWADGASEISEKAQSAAEMIDKAFSGVDAAVGAMDSLVDLMWDLASIAGTEHLEAEDFAGLAWGVDMFMGVLTFALTRLQAAVAGLDLDKLADIGDDLKSVGDGLRSMADGMAALIELVAPATDGVETMTDGIAAAQEALAGALGLVRGVLANPPWADVTWMPYGQGLMDSLIAGIVSRMERLAAVLGSVRALMPSSPAKEGPLSEPVDWGFLTEGLSEAMASINAALAVPQFAVAMPDLQSALGGAGMGSVEKNFSWTINNPAEKPEDITRRIRTAELVDRYN